MTLIHRKFGSRAAAPRAREKKRMRARALHEPRARKQVINMRLYLYFIFKFSCFRTQWLISYLTLDGLPGALLAVKYSILLMKCAPSHSNPFVSGASSIS